MPPQSRQHSAKNASRPGRRRWRWGRALSWLVAAVLLYRLVVWGWMGLIDVPTERERLTRWAEGRFQGAGVRIRGLTPSIDWTARGRLELRDITVDHPQGDFIFAEAPWNYFLDLPRLDLEMPVRSLYGGDGGTVSAVVRGGRLAILRDAFGEWSVAGLNEAPPPGDWPSFPFGRPRPTAVELALRKGQLAFRDEATGLSIQAGLAGTATWSAEANRLDGAWQRGKWTVTRGTRRWEGGWEAPFSRFAWRPARDGGWIAQDIGLVAEVEALPLAAGMVLGEGWPEFGATPLFTGTLSLAGEGLGGEERRLRLTADGRLTGLAGALFHAAPNLPVKAEWRSPAMAAILPPFGDESTNAAPPADPELDIPPPEGAPFHIDIGQGGWLFDGATDAEGRVCWLRAIVRQLRIDSIPREFSQPPAWLSWLHAQGGEVSLRASAASVEGWPLGPMALRFHHAEEVVEPPAPTPGPTPPSARRVLYGQARTRLLGGAVIRGEAGPWWPGRQFVAYRVEAESLPIAPFLGLWRSRIPEAVRPMIAGGSATVSLRYVPTEEDLAKAAQKAAAKKKIAAPAIAPADAPKSAPAPSDATPAPDAAATTENKDGTPEWEFVLEARDVTITIPSSGAVWKTLADTDAGLLAAQALVDRAEAAAGRDDAPSPTSRPTPPAVVARTLAGLTFPLLTFTYTRQADGRERIQLHGHCWELGELDGQVRRSRDGSLAIGLTFKQVPEERWRTVPGLSEAVRGAAARLAAADGPGWRFDFLHERGKPTVTTPTYAQTIFRETR